MKNDYPPIIIKSGEKEKYLTALNKADVGDINAFHEYMAEQLIWSLEVAIKAAKGESIEDIDDVEKELLVWKKQFVGTKENVIPKSDDQIYELYENGIKQLFELFIDKMKQFDELFTSTEIRGWVNGSNGNHAGIEYINNYFDNFSNAQARFISAKEVNEGTPFSHNDTLSYISLTIELKGYKYDDKNIFNLLSDIKLDFLPFVYKIEATPERCRAKNLCYLLEHQFALSR